MLGLVYSVPVWVIRSDGLCRKFSKMIHLCAHLDAILLTWSVVLWPQPSGYGCWLSFMATPNTRKKLLLTESLSLKLSCNVYNIILLNLLQFVAFFWSSWGSKSLGRLPGNLSLVLLGLFLNCASSIFCNVCILYPGRVKLGTETADMMQRFVFDCWVKRCRHLSLFDVIISGCRKARASGQLLHHCSLEFQLHLLVLNMFKILCITQKDFDFEIWWKVLDRDAVWIMFTIYDNNYCIIIIVVVVLGH